MDRKQSRQSAVSSGDIQSVVVVVFLLPCPFRRKVRHWTTKLVLIEYERIRQVLKMLPLSVPERPTTTSNRFQAILYFERLGGGYWLGWEHWNPWPAAGDPGNWVTDRVFTLHIFTVQEGETFLVCKFYHYPSRIQECWTREGPRIWGARKKVKAICHSRQLASDLPPWNPPVLFTLDWRSEPTVQSVYNCATYFGWFAGCTALLCFAQSCCCPMGIMYFININIKWQLLFRNPWDHQDGRRRRWPGNGFMWWWTEQDRILLNGTRQVVFCGWIKEWVMCNIGRSIREIPVCLAGLGFGLKYSQNQKFSRNKKQSSV